MRTTGPHKKSGSNSDIVVRMYECFNQGDLDTIRKEIFAPDLNWRLPGRNPVGGEKSNAEEVLAFFWRTCEISYPGHIGRYPRLG